MRSTTATTCETNNAYPNINNYSYLESSSNRRSNHVSNSSSNSKSNYNSNASARDHMPSVELQQQQQQQQHYNNNYYYYYNYNLSYAPPSLECRLLGGPKARLQQLKRRTRHELLQWPLLMQLVVLMLWLHAKFWQIVREQILMHRRRWH